MHTIFNLNKNQHAEIKNDGHEEDVPLDSTNYPLNIHAKLQSG